MYLIYNTFAIIGSGPLSAFRQSDLIQHLWGGDTRGHDLPGKGAWGRGHGRRESQFGTAIIDTKEAGPPMWVILCSCFFAGLGFVGEAVNDAVALNAAYQHENILERAGEYLDPRMTLFTAVLVIVAMAEAGCFLYQLRFKRRITRATLQADAMAREVANETRAFLARLNEYDLGRELWISITDAMKKTYASTWFAE